MNYPSLAANLRELRWFSDALRPFVHVALTARRKSHSGLLARLEEAERAQPERHQHHGAPASRHADPHENASEQDGGGE